MNDELLLQMREANEKLVVATVRAEQLAEEAEQARAVAADSEERFRSLVIASSAIVWRADANGRMAFDSALWTLFTGLPMPHGTQEWLEAIHSDDRERVTAAWETAVATSVGYTCEHRLRRSNGGYAWVVARGVPLLRDGTAREWIGMLTDISERVEIERAREQFMAILGHDLRSPLAAISISAEALQQLDLQSPYGILVEEIGLASRRMSALVQDVMDFARGRLGNGIPLSRTRCNLGALCSLIVNETQRAHQDRAFSVTTQGDLDGTWDSGRLAQVLTNVIGNAVTHGQDPIEIALAGVEDAVVLTIANHGPTIPETTLATLLEPFSRASGRDSMTKGLGLGLYIVSEIVRAHHGTIAVTSEDELTTVVVHLPRVPGPTDSVR